MAGWAQTAFCSSLFWPFNMMTSELCYLVVFCWDQRLRNRRSARMFAAAARQSLMAGSAPSSIVALRCGMFALCAFGFYCAAGCDWVFWASNGPIAAVLIMCWHRIPTRRHRASPSVLFVRSFTCAAGFSAMLLSVCPAVLGSGQCGSSSLA
jgi:hypothetical protein